MEKGGVSLRVRLTFLSSQLLLNILLVGMIAAWNAREIANYLDELGRQHLPAVRFMTLTDMMHDGLRAVVYRAFMVSEITKGNGLDEVIKEYSEFSQNIIGDLGKISTLGLEANIAKEIADVRPEVDAYVVLGSQIIAHLESRERLKAIAMLPTYEEKFESLERGLEKLGHDIQLAADDVVTHGGIASERSKTLNWAIVLIGLLLGMTSAHFISKGIIARLSGYATTVSDESSHLAVTSQTINQASVELSSSTTEQAASIEQTVASVEQISAMMAQNADNASQALGIATEGKNYAENGRLVVSRMVTSMAKINESNDQLATILKLIDEIRSKTKIINDIAFETKLLSFNASIEAARAGAHGRGFAVVAEEVGKLAAVSSRAADEVRLLLESSMQQVSDIVAATRQRVESGTEVSHECEQTFHSMSGSLAKIAHSVELIATASREQESGIRQTKKAMTEMDNVTRTNDSNASVLAGMAQELAKAAMQLEDSAAGMSRMVYGKERATLALDAENHETDLPAGVIANFNPGKPRKPMFRLNKRDKAHKRKVA